MQGLHIITGSSPDMSTSYMQIKAIPWPIKWKPQSKHIKYLINKLLIPKCKVRKSTAIPIHTMKAYMGSRGTTPVILNFGTGWRWVINIMPQLFYPLNKRLGWPQSQPGHFRQESTFLSLLWFKPWSVLSAAPSLYWLSYPKFLKVCLNVVHLPWHTYFNAKF